MAKLTLTPLTSAYQAVPALNANNVLIEAALENTLSRDGTTPNQMNALFDMNSNRIINLAQAVGGSDAVSLTQLQTLLSAAATDPIVGPIAATLVTIVDAGGFYTAIDVEGALQEAFIAINAISTSVGAAGVGVDDAVGNFTGTNVETVLAEIIADYAATTASNGASKIGIEDTAALFSSTTVEAALAEIKTDLSATGGAATVGTLDIGGHFAATEVEATLQEIGTTLATLTPGPGRRGALVQRTTNVALAAATETVVTFDTKVYDTDSIHDLVTNTSRLTVPSGVTLIRLNGAAGWLSSNTGFRTLRMKKNGGVGTFDPGLTSYRPVMTMDVAFGGIASTQIQTPVLTVTAGDFFELSMESDNGIDGAANTIIFEMEILG